LAAWGKHRSGTCCRSHGLQTGRHPDLNICVTSAGGVKRMKPMSHQSNLTVKSGLASCALQHELNGQGQCCLCASTELSMVSVEQDHDS